MSGWDDPTGEPYFAVGICDRCGRRFLLSQLIQDGNLPGLRVCKDDWDELDPYRLPARQPDNLVLPFVRPDVPIGVTSPSVPYALPGFILIESGGAYVVAESGLYIITEGVSALTTESGIDIDADGATLIVEPWAS